MTLNTGPAVSGKAAPLRGCVTIYVRWFPGDYLRDTTHLSLLEDGAYRRLLDLYYTQGKALTTNRKKLYRQLRVTDPLEMAAVESVLEQYFFRRGQNLHNSRANAELLRNKEITAVRVRGGKERAKRAAHAQLKLSSSSAIPEPEPEPDRSTESEHVLLQIDRVGVPLSLFSQFRKLRESLHRPILPGTEDLIFAELIQFQTQGEDPTEILTRAVRTSSWKLSPNNHKGESENAKRQRRTKAALNRLLQESGSEPH